MASLVLGAAGAFVGSFFGPIGTSIGWTIGAALGNSLFGKGQQGPRLTDLKVHNSSYGMMIPIIYGTVRISGIVIWQTDLQEHEHKSGGKGGPEVTNYTYTVSLAIDLCEGPIGGVLRIWADSRLVYDQTTTNPTDFPFTLYLGTETQEPDPTIEGIEGVGNVSGNRGVAYIVFADLLLTDYGDRIPNFTFEVFTSGQPIPWRVSTITDTPVNGFPTGAVYGTCARAGSGGYGPTSAMLDAEGRLLLGYVDGTDTLALVHAPSVNYTVKAFDMQGTFIEDVFNDTIINPPGNDHSLFDVIPCVNNPLIQAVHQGGSADGSVPAWYVNGVFHTFIIDPTGNDTNASVITNSFAKPSWSESNEAVYCVGQLFGAGAHYVAKWPAPGGVPAALPSAVYYYPPLPGGGISCSVDDLGNVWAISVQPTNHADYQLHYLDSDLNLIHGWDHTQLPGAGDVTTEIDAGGHYFTVWNGIIFYSADGLPCRAYYIDFNSWTFTLTDPGTVNLHPGSFGSSNMISLGNGLAVGYDGVFSLQPRSGPVTLASIVSDLSVRAGLTTAEIDVEELTDLVDGYVIGSQMQARSAIEPLQVAWPFDAVEHDVQVRFPRRGVDGVVFDVDDNDLGAYIPPGDPPALMTTQRLQEVDLPRIMDVTFLNKDTDYQNGEEREQRLVTTSELATTLQLPIVMTSAKAQQVCAENLYNAWVERERFGLILPRKYVRLEPGDVGRANGRTMRITRKVDGADGLIRLDAVATTLAVFQHAAPAAEGVGMPGGGGTPPTSPPVAQGTDAILLDLPLITDTDNPVGWYAAMNGHVQRAWVGASLYKSTDGGSSYAVEDSSTVADTFGDCSTTLGDFGGGNIFDEVNSLTVVLNAGSDTLSSVTRLAVLNGANMAAVGVPGTDGIRNIEIIQFRDATLTGTRTYVLTGLRRGRRGSEWMIPQHTSGEKFVLLPTSTNVLGNPAEIYLARLYRAVTSGRALSTASDITFTNWAAAARPYAPCKLGGGREVNGDITLTWKRRTRIGGAWLPFGDVPLSEPSEAYLIRIYPDSTYTTPLRFIGLIPSETYTYTLSDQIADFGSPTPSPLYWTVSQLGTFVYGTEARGAT